MRRCRGFTLVETIIFIVVVSIAVLGVTMLFSQSVRHSYQPLERQKAVALASGYMEEILRKKWDENTPLGGGCVATSTGMCAAYLATRPPGACGAAGRVQAGVCEPRYDVSPSYGPDTGEAREQYDDVDDYGAITDQSPPVDAMGQPLDGEYPGYSVTVTVQKPAAAWNGIAAEDVKQVDVTVTPPGGGELSLRGYRVNY